MTFIAILSLICITSAESICKHLNVSTNLKLHHDDVISKGVVHKNWERKSKNPVVVQSNQLIDFVYITAEDPTLTLDNFRLDFDDHYFADTQVRIDNRQNGKHTEYAIEITYRCRSYGGAMINYELDFSIPECGDQQIYWKKLCGNPLTTRDYFSVDMVYKNYKHTIVTNGVVQNSTYFDADLDNYVFNVPFDVNQLVFLLYMKPTTVFEGPLEDPYVADSITLKQQPEVNISLPYVDTDENVLQAWFEGSIQEGGLITVKQQELKLGFKCKRFGTSKVEMAIPFDYFKDINLVFVKDCTTGNKVHDVIRQTYDEKGEKSFIIYIVIGLFTIGLVLNLCVGKKKGLANIPLFHTAAKLILCITCLDRTNIGLCLGSCLGIYGDNENRQQDEPDETFSLTQKQFYGSI